MEGTEKLLDSAEEAAVTDSHEVWQHQVADTGSRAEEESLEAHPSHGGEAAAGEADNADPPEGVTESLAEETTPQGDLFIAEAIAEPKPGAESDADLKAVIEAAIYVTDEPLSAEQIAAAVGRPLEQVKEILKRLASEYSAPDRGLTIRELAGGYKMSTKPEHHEGIRLFVKRLQPPLKLSLPALETLAVIAYKQPITAPEIMDIRGVQGAGVLKTLLDRKLIATAGRKNVLGKPIMYKTTREFLVQFGLSSLAELPTLKEFEELGRLALTESEKEELPASAASTPEVLEQESEEEQTGAEASGTTEEQVSPREKQTTPQGEEEVEEHTRMDEGPDAQLPPSGQDSSEQRAAAPSDPEAGSRKNA